MSSESLCQYCHHYQLKNTSLLNSIASYLCGGKKVNIPLCLFKGLVDRFKAALMNIPVMQETQAQSLESGSSPGEGNGKPLQYSCLENSMDAGAWWAAIHGVAESNTTECRCSDSFKLISQNPFSKNGLLDLR